MPLPWTTREELALVLTPDEGGGDFVGLGIRVVRPLLPVPAPALTPATVEDLGLGSAAFLPDL